MNKVIKIYEDRIGEVELVDKMQQETLLKVANSARISYDKRKELADTKDTKLSKFLWTDEHTSPFRHTYYTFRVKIPLFVSRQFLKYQVGSNHRTLEVDGNEVSLEVFDLFFDLEKGCSWNEISGRYAKIKPEFYVPSRMRSNAGHANKQASSDIDDWPDGLHDSWVQEILDDCEMLYNKYEAKIEAGIAREIARMYLPQSMYTEAYWTVSLQSVIWFLHQRLKIDAQFEIRKMAEGIYEIMKEDLERLGISREDL